MPLLLRAVSWGLLLLIPRPLFLLLAAGLIRLGGGYRSVAFGCLSKQ
jgi:hypothetical protein